MENSFYVQYLISNCEYFSKTAEKYFNKAQEKLMNDEIDFGDLYLSKFYLNSCIENTKKLLKISSEYPSLFEDREFLEISLNGTKKIVKYIEEIIDSHSKQQVETK